MPLQFFEYTTGQCGPAVFFMPWCRAGWLASQLHHPHGKLLERASNGQQRPTAASSASPMPARVLGAAYDERIRFFWTLP